MLQDIKEPKENDVQEITLKVKMDSYKALQNYLHNELKITKLDVKIMIGDYLDKAIKHALEDDAFVMKHLDNQVRSIVSDRISKLSNSNSWRIEDKIDNAIEQAIGKQIKERVEEKLKNLDLSKIL